MPKSDKLDAAYESADERIEGEPERDENAVEDSDGSAGVGAAQDRASGKGDGASEVSGESEKEPAEEKPAKGKSSKGKPAKDKPSEGDDSSDEGERRGKGKKDRTGEKSRKLKKSGNPVKGTKRGIAMREASKAADEEKESVKFKSPHSPKWWVPVMVSLMIIGLIIVVLAYVFNGQFPVKTLGNGNLFIGFGFMLTGFLMTMGWK